MLQYYCETLIIQIQKRIVFKINSQAKKQQQQQIKNKHKKKTKKKNDLPADVNSRVSSLVVLY